MRQLFRTTLTGPGSHAHIEAISDENDYDVPLKSIRAQLHQVKPNDVKLRTEIDDSGLNIWRFE